MKKYLVSQTSPSYYSRAVQNDPQIEKKLLFWVAFLQAFLEHDFAWILRGFHEARNLKNSNFASTGARFS